MTTTALRRPLPERRTLQINRIAAGLSVAWLVLVFFTLQAEPDDFKQFWRATVQFMQSGDLYATPGYNYPSIFAYLISPLALLDQWYAQRVWFALNSVLMLIFVGLCVRLSNSALARRYWGIVLLGALVAPPVRLSLQLGQVSFLLSVLIVGSFALAQRHKLIAGALLALAALIKIYPALIGLYYLLRKPRAVAWWGIVAGIVLVGLTLLADGITPYVALYQKMQAEVGFPYAAEFNVSLVGFFERLFTSSPYSTPVVHNPLLARGLALIVSAGIFIVCVAVGRQTASTLERLLVFCIWLCSMLLLSPLNGYYNFLLVLLPLVSMLKYLEDHPQRGIRNWLIVATALVCIPPTWSDALPGIYEAVHVGWGVLFLTPSIYGVALYIGLLWVVLRRVRAAVGGQEADKTRS